MYFYVPITEKEVTNEFKKIDDCKKIILEEENEDIRNYFQASLNLVEEQLKNIIILPELNRKEKKKWKKRKTKEQKKF